MGASDSKPEIKIVLAGKTGVGKSSIGNTILKKKIFQSESSPISITKDSALGVGMVYDRRITVIDTPGIFDTSDDEENIKQKLIRALVDCAPGPFVLVIVLKVEKYTLQERETQTKICEYLNEINFNQSLVVFTHGEQLEGQTIEEFVRKSPKLQEYVEKCGGRCHVIDSKYWKNSLWGYKSNRFQVKNLLDTIDKMREENGCHTNELLQIVGEEIEEEMNRSDHNLPQQVRQETAMRNVFEKLLIRFAGVATGTLVGAMMGVAVPVATLVAILKGVINMSATDATTDETAEGAELTESAYTLTEELDEATAGETRVTAAAVFGAAAAAAAGTSASVSAVAAVGAASAVAATAAAGATAAVEAIVAAGAAAGATASAGAAATVGATAAVGAAAVEAGVAAGAAAGATAAVGAAAVEAGVAAGAAAGATAAGGAVALEAGVAAGAGIGAAAGAGIAVGAIFGAAALAGAIGGAITGYKAVDDADSVLDAIKTAAKSNYKNMKEIVKNAEELPSKVTNRLVRRLQEGSSLEILLNEEE